MYHQFEQPPALNLTKPEKALRCGLVALLLERDIQLGTVFVNRSPHQPGLATQIHEHFVQMPGAARLSSRSLDSPGEGRTEFFAPSADRLVADDHAALESQFLNVA